MASIQMSTLLFTALVAAIMLYLLLTEDVLRLSDNITFAPVSQNEASSVVAKFGPEYDAKIKQWVRDTYYGDACAVTRRNTSECICTSPLPTCTLDLLRSYIIEHDKIAGSGYWATFGGRNLFCPSFCAIKHDQIQTEGCRISENPIKVVVFGDSTAMYLAEGLISALEKGGFGCSTSREEEQVQAGVIARNVEYFRVPAMQAELLGAPPSLYRGRLDKCFIKRCDFRVKNNESARGQTNERPTFDVEYISHTNMLETTIRLNRDPSVRSEQFSTFTEYVFRYYMSHHGYPHLLVFYVPFHHQKWHSTFSKAAAEIQYVQSMMEAFLPPTTKILWLPAHLECPKLAPQEIMKYPRGNDMDANQLLHGLNHVLYTTLSPYLKDSGGNTYSFFDFAKISCPQKCISHLDAVHLTPDFYALIASKILQIACA